MALTRPSTWIRQHPVTVFYILAFAISWLGWLPGVAASRGFPMFASRAWQVLLLLPAGGPAIAAALASWLAGERGGLRARFRMMLGLRVSAGWYVMAVAIPAALIAVAAIAGRLFVPSQYVSPPLPAAGILWTLVVALAANPWEEVGWRGFSLTRLQKRYDPLIAPLIVGVLWGLWHIPLFLSRGSPMSTFRFWPWFAALIGQSYILAWIFGRTSGSVAIASVFHVTSNVSCAVIGIESHIVLAGINGAVALSLLLFGGMRAPRRAATRTATQS